jgi:hypothetical protein
MKSIPNQVPDDTRADAPRAKAERPDTSQGDHRLLGRRDKPNQGLGVLQLTVR